jgi:hypothetical protein
VPEGQPEQSQRSQEEKRKMSQRKIQHAVILLKGELIGKITWQTGKLQLLARKGEFAGNGELSGVKIVNRDFLMRSPRAARSALATGLAARGSRRRVDCGHEFPLTFNSFFAGR